MAEEETHVHFEEEETNGKDDSSIRVTTGPGTVTAHLGLLQIHHLYQVTFSLPSEVCPVGKATSLRLADENAITSVNCRLVGAEENATDETGKQATVITLELKTIKEKLQTETIVLSFDNEPPKKIKLTLKARILGKRMGTPLLKDGIRSLEAFPDPDETDCGSDWPGF